MSNPVPAPRPTAGVKEWPMGTTIAELHAWQRANGREMVVELSESQFRRRLEMAEIRTKLNALSEQHEDLEEQRSRVSKGDCCPVCAQRLSRAAHTAVTEAIDEQLNAVASSMRWYWARFEQVSAEYNSIPRPTCETWQRIVMPFAGTPAGDPLPEVFEEDSGDEDFAMPILQAM